MQLFDQDGNPVNVDPTNVFDSNCPGDSAGQLLPYHTGFGRAVQNVYPITLFCVNSSNTVVASTQPNIPPSSSRPARQAETPFNTQTRRVLGSRLPDVRKIRQTTADLVRRRLPEASRSVQARRNKAVCCIRDD